MHKGQFLFSQLVKFLPKRAFDCLVALVYEYLCFVICPTCRTNLHDNYCCPIKIGI